MRPRPLAGDLTTCGDVLFNYLEAYDDIPWPDLRYMFGEVRRPRSCRRAEQATRP